MTSYERRGVIKSVATRMFIQQLAQSLNQAYIRVLEYRPFVKESTDDQ